MIAELINEKFKHELSQVWIGFLGEVISYNKAQAKAEVQPLIEVQTKEGAKRLPVIQCPVVCYFGNDMAVFPDFKRGDIVELKGNIYPIDLQIKGQVQKENELRFALGNCSIIGGHIKRPTIINSQVTKEGIVICETSGNMYAQFSSSKIEFKTGMSEPQKSLLGEDTIQALKDLIDAILDITVMTPVGPSSPVSAMPSNVTRLNQIKTQLDSLLTNNFKHN